MIWSAEHTRKVRAAVLKRATINGVVFCECCKRPARRYEMHHVFGRVVESEEVCIILCCDYKDKCHDHATGEGQIRLNGIKIKICAELIEKHGEEEARKRAGGKLYFE